MACEGRVAEERSMSGASSRRRGHQFERDLAAWLTGYLGVRVRTSRSVAGGFQHGPDLVTVDEHGHVSQTVAGLTWELKNHKRIDLAGWVDQADHGGPFCVVAKRRNRAVEESYAIMPLRVLVEVLGQHRAGSRGTGGSDRAWPVPHDSLEEPTS